MEVIGSLQVKAGAELAPQPKDWWVAVQSIMALMAREGMQARDESLFREELIVEGFAQPDINQALEFVETIFLSGYLGEVVGMMAPDYNLPRLLHPVERLSLPESVLRDLDSCRGLGILTTSLVERIIEGLRCMDVRDWELEEVQSFILEVLESSGSVQAREQYQAFLAGKLQDTFH